MLLEDFMQEVNAKKIFKKKKKLKKYELSLEIFLLKCKKEIMKVIVKNYNTGCLYNLTYNLLIQQLYWLYLLSVNSIKRSIEYFILFFPIKTGFIVGEFIDDQSEELLSDKINELYIKRFSYQVMFPLRNVYPLAYNYRIRFDKNNIKNFFRDLSISRDTHKKNFS